MCTKDQSMVGLELDPYIYGLQFHILDETTTRYNQVLNVDGVSQAVTFFFWCKKKSTKYVSKQCYTVKIFYPQFLIEYMIVIRLNIIVKSIYLFKSY